MIKKILATTILLLMLFQGAAFAFDTNGDVIFKDTLYGAAIGSILGVAFYMLDQDDFYKKFGSGLIIGTLGGVAYGVSETSGFVELQKNEMKFAIPTPLIEKTDEDVRVSASLFKANFKKDKILF